MNETAKKLLSFSSAHHERRARGTASRAHKGKEHEIEALHHPHHYSLLERLRRLHVLFKKGKSKTSLKKGKKSKLEEMIWICR